MSGAEATSGGRPLPGGAFVVGLAALSGMGPARLAALLQRWDPEQAWHATCGGQVHRDAGVVEGARGFSAELSRRWALEAAGIDVAGRFEAHLSAAVGITFAGAAGFPDALAGDPEAPAVLFHRGSLEVLDRPRVAVVGTRRCTSAGRATARELGRDLAGAGVCVVSGLASGIDGEAHLGSLEADAAAPVAVVATGLDVVYPMANADLWRRVASAGCVLSEYPLGTRPERWRFPARNRILAGLADVVVVVESHARGGSLHTVDAALERDRPVMAVPGPVRSPASKGTNDLLAAGSAPVRDAGDVLAVLGLDGAAATRGRADPADPSDAGASALVQALGWEPATVEELALRLDRPLGPLAVDLSELEHQGWVVRRGSWYERTVRPG